MVTYLLSSPLGSLHSKPKLISVSICPHSLYSASRCRCPSHHPHHRPLGRNRRRRHDSHSTLPSRRLARLDSHHRRLRPPHSPLPRRIHRRTSGLHDPHGRRHRHPLSVSAIRRPSRPTGRRRWIRHQQLCFHPLSRTDVWRCSRGCHLPKSMGQESRDGYR